MEYNYIIKKVRYALDLDDHKLLKIFKLGGLDISRDLLCQYCAKFDEDNYLECDSDAIEAFLNGLILHKRGHNGKQAHKSDHRLNNNQILRKIRIALDYKDTDMLEVIELGGMTFSKNQLTALFRSTDNKHYTECKDQLLRKFLLGLVEKMRNKKPKRNYAILDFDNFGS